MPPVTLPAASDGAARAMEDWLAQMSAVRGASPATITAYRQDVSGYLGFLALHWGGPAGRAALGRVSIADMRAWMARERGRGLSARSLARALSAVKSFHAWLAEAHDIAAAAVSATRGPRQKVRLPRPVAPDSAKALIATVELQSLEPWIAARDAAVVTLLYGCGLRISEALSLRQADAPLPGALRITGKGGRERIVPVLPVAARAVETYQSLCPYAPGPARAAVSRRAGRAAEPAGGAKGDAGRARATRPAGHRHAARAAAFLRHASLGGRRRPAHDPGAVGSRLARHHPSLYRRRSDPTDGSLRARPSQGARVTDRRQAIAAVTVLVPDYDAGIAFYVGVLGFRWSRTPSSLRASAG